MGKDTDGLLNEMFFVNYEDFAEIDFRENWKLQGTNIYYFLV